MPEWAARREDTREDAGSYPATIEWRLAIGLEPLIKLARVRDGPFRGRPAYAVAETAGVPRIDITLGPRERPS